VFSSARHTGKRQGLRGGKGRKVDDLSVVSCARMLGGGGPAGGGNPRIKPRYTYVWGGKEKPAFESIRES